MRETQWCCRSWRDLREIWTISTPPITMHPMHNQIPPDLRWPLLPITSSLPLSSTSRPPASQHPEHKWRATLCSKISSDPIRLRHRADPVVLVVYWWVHPHPWFGQPQPDSARSVRLNQVRLSNSSRLWRDDIPAIWRNKHWGVHRWFREMIQLERSNHSTQAREVRTRVCRRRS